MKISTNVNGIFPNNKKGWEKTKWVIKLKDANKSYHFSEVRDE